LDKSEFPLGKVGQKRCLSNARGSTNKEQNILPNSNSSESSRCELSNVNTCGEVSSVNVPSTTNEYPTTFQVLKGDSFKGNNSTTDKSNPTTVHPVEKSCSFNASTKSNTSTIPAASRNIALSIIQKNISVRLDVDEGGGVNVNTNTGIKICSKQLKGNVTNSGETGQSDEDLESREGGENNQSLTGNGSEKTIVGKKDARNCQCSQCGRILADASSLKRHERVVHSKLKPINCPHCDKKFAVTNYLTEHINAVHSKIKMWVCDLCGESLRSKKAMQTHLLIHQEGSKKLPCPECGQMFRHRNTLVKHVARIHKFSAVLHKLKCDECGKLFNHDEGLKRHVRRMHPHGLEKPFRCDLCRAAFMFQYDLNRHRKRHKTAAKTNTSSSLAKTKTTPSADSVLLTVSSAVGKSLTTNSTTSSLIASSPTVVTTPLYNLVALGGADDSLLTPLLPVSVETIPSPNRSIKKHTLSPLLVTLNNALPSVPLTVSGEEIISTTICDDTAIEESALAAGKNVNSQTLVFDSPDSQAIVASILGK